MYKIQILVEANMRQYQGLPGQTEGKFSVHSHKPSQLGRMYVWSVLISTCFCFQCLGVLLLLLFYFFLLMN